MGYGEYSHAAHVAMTSTRTSSASVFTARSCHPLMEPHKASRESRDSEDHPDALPVMFALDVTGSMGEIPKTLANRTLPDFMGALLAAGVRHPAVCFAAVGHATDRAPLQVGQFESSAVLIDLWLTRMWLEGGGAGDHEAYELAMYFAARKTRLDSVEKRGRRGFFFLTGDSKPNLAVSRVQVQKIIGDVLPTDIPIRDLLEELMHAYEPFFFGPPGASPSLMRAWRDLLGDRAIALEHVEDAAHVASGLVSLLEGAARSVDDLAQRFQAAGVERKRVARIARALVPFAASVGRDGAPVAARGNLSLPRGDRPSGLAR